MSLPIMPIAAKKEFLQGSNVKVVRADGVIIMWYQDGSIILLGPDGERGALYSTGLPEEGEIFYTHECGDEVVWDDDCKGLCCTAGIRVGICHCCGTLTDE